MTQEEKDLLLKDLCARLPYDIILSKENEQEFFIGIEYGESFITKDVVRKTPQIATERFGGSRFVRDIEDVKPYLRPMSSMTEEDMDELNRDVGGDRFIFKDGVISVDENFHHEGHLYSDHEDYVNIIDWLNAHYFDYRGLIEKGLAIEAPKVMYK